MYYIYVNKHLNILSKIGIFSKILKLLKVIIIKHETSDYTNQR
jgi:hypothetical protein